MSAVHQFTTKNNKIQPQQGIIKEKLLKHILNTICGLSAPKNFIIPQEISKSNHKTQQKINKSTLIFDA